MSCTAGMTGCRLGCLHRRLVQDYRAERLRQAEHAAEAALGYRREYAEYLEAHPLITFRQWLEAHRIPAEVRHVHAA